MNELIWGISMDLLKELSSVGCDTDSGLKRFSGNADLYCKMLAKYPQTVDQNEVFPLLNEEEYEMAKANAHNLKGVTGNLSLTPLFEGYVKIVSSIRAGDYQNAIETMITIQPVQDRIIEIIEKFS